MEARKTKSVTTSPATQQHVHREDDPRTFVFGSNVLGIHGGGAAGYASAKLGAERGVGSGPTGRCYALPTCKSPGRPLVLTTVARHVARFLEFARAHPETRFFVSAVGCGIAGFQEDQVAPLFADAPANCDLPPAWKGGSGAAVVAGAKDP